MATIMTRSAAKAWWGVDLPKGVLSLHKSHPEGDWIEYTKFEQVKEKVRQQEANIEYKRRSSHLVPCFVWVFYNDSFLYGGWYIYIKTLKEDYGLSIRYKTSKDLIEKIMTLYPCGIIPKIEFVKLWFVKFATEYHHFGFKRGKGKWKQGLAQCWCVIDEAGRLFDIVGWNNRHGVLYMP